MKKSFDVTWEEIHSTNLWGQYPAEPVIRFIAKNYYSKKRSELKILDFGCGGGAHTWYLCREGFQVYAFDGSASAVKHTGEKLEKEGYIADLRVADALGLTYKENFFDAIIDSCSICTNIMTNIYKMYEEAYRILKPGGGYFEHWVY